MKYLAGIGVLVATTLALGQQVDQPWAVMVDIDSKITSGTPFDYRAGVQADFGFGFVTLVAAEGGEEDPVYNETHTLIPVGQEVQALFMPQYVDVFECYLTPPPGYTVYFDNYPIPHLARGTLSKELHEFALSLQILPDNMGNLALGETSLPTVGTFRWNIGLGYLPTGENVGMLTIVEKEMGEIADRTNLKVVTTQYANPSEGGAVEVHREEGILVRIRTDVLVDVTDISGGYQIAFYPAGEFDPSADIEITEDLDLGTPFRRIEVVSVGEGVQLSVYDVQETGSTLMIRHELSHDEGEDTWTMQSGDGASWPRTEVCDYGGEDRDTALVTISGESVEARRTLKTFTEVSEQKDVTKIEEDYGGKSYTTTYAYSTSENEWLQDRQFPDGRWQRAEFDVIGRMDTLYKPFKNSWYSPIPSTSGEVTYLHFDQAPAPASSSPKDVLDTVNGWLSAPDAWSEYEFRALPTERTVRVGNQIVEHSLSSHTLEELNAREVMASRTEHYVNKDDALTTISKKYAAILQYPEDASVFADLPLCEDRPDGTKTVWLHQPGAYTEGGDTLSDFIPSQSYHPATANRYWRTIVFHCRTSEDATIAEFGPGPGNEIESIYMERDRSTIEVTIRGYQGRVVQKETFVFTGATPESANLPTSYEKIDWVRNEYKAEWGHRLWRSSSIRSQPGYYDRVHERNGGRLVSRSNEIGQAYSFEYDALGRLVQESLLDAAGTPERSTLSWYNAAGDVVATARIPGNLDSIPASPDELEVSPRLVSKSEYDLGGWVRRREDTRGVEKRFD